MTNHLYQNDLPDDLDLGPIVAIDCETMGLNPHRDRLCLIQMSSGDGTCHLVQVAPGQTEAPNICKMLADPGVLKLFQQIVTGYETCCKKRSALTFPSFSSNPTGGQKP